ncbi:alpha/beta hydrolase [Saccharothrix sp. S26]|uniref:alpha/beta hydrolase n=1 Tax=Saccharothrix sp. S26 TaxID=2907215 RepID=UPI001F248D2F|nr:alpha/beta hydrolase [Saccharothrix sp. S26]MCE6993588.1 alpha/beta hydrolase [Saccharothrix sp. S26]
MAYAIDPELAAAVHMLPEVDLTDLSAVRALMADHVREAEVDETGVTVTERATTRADGTDLTLRVYRPDDAAPAAILAVHGGGFVIGSIDADHGRNVRLARQTGAVVVAVGYRLAPETPFPGGLEDCYAGLEWLAANAVELGVDPDRIAVNGHSAGGGLCAALALLARDRGGPRIRFQFLGVPEVDDRLETRSARHFVDTPVWDRRRAEISWDCYLGPGRRGGPDVSPYAAPARAEDLTGLPPAYVSAMEFDPLRDEAVAYAVRLMDAGVPVELHVFSGTFHGSVLVEHAQQAQRELEEEVVVLRRALGL